MHKSEVWDSGDAYEPYVGRWSRRAAPVFLDWAEIPGGRVLDVGCGTGALSQALIDHRIRQVVGIDPSGAYVRHAATHVKKAAERTSFLVGNAMALPFASDNFDGVVSGLVLNFVPQPLAAVREMGRLSAKAESSPAMCGITRGGWS